MAIEFQCPKCAVAIRVPDAAAGKKGTCPNPGCGIKLRVPAPEIPANPSPAAVEPAPAFPTFPAPDAGFGPSPAPTFSPSPARTFSPSPAPTPVSDITVSGVAAPQLASPGGNRNDAAQPIVDPTAPILPDQPVVIEPTVSMRNRRRSRRKRTGIWFPLLCGLALIGGVGWLFRSAGLNLDGPRVGKVVSGRELQPKIVSKNLIDVKPEVLKTVLEHFEFDPERLRGSLMTVEFGSEPGGLYVNLLVAPATRVFQFPIDLDLRAYYEANVEKLTAERDARFTRSLKLFFTEWEARLRNGEANEQSEDYRMTVGRTACVNGLGYCVSAKVKGELYPCAYEDESNLYFILPETTTGFEVVPYFADGTQSPFQGRYDITVN